MYGVSRPTRPASVSMSSLISRKLELLEQSAEKLKSLTATHERDVADLREVITGGASPGEAKESDVRGIRDNRDSVDHEESLTSTSRDGRPNSASPTPRGFSFSVGHQASLASIPASSAGSFVMHTDSGAYREGSQVMVPDLHPLWRNHYIELEDAHTLDSPLRRGATNWSFGSDRPHRAGDLLRNSCWLQPFVLLPTSPMRIVWDIMSIFAITYDLLTLPLMAFNFDELTFAKFASLVTSMFWACDIVLAFFVGHNREDGCVEMRLGPIARKYFKSWFALDFTVVSVDLSLFVLDTGVSQTVGVARAGKAARVVRLTRFMRMLRLIRVVKMMSVMEEVAELLFTRTTVTFLNIIRMMFGVAIFAHIIACVWYAVGKSAGDISTSWLAELELEQASPVYRYVCSYHWTMAQFTPAPVDLHPANFQERLFTVVVLFGGFVMFSSMLGSTAALISQSRQQAFQKLRETDHIRSFFVDNHISLGLSSRIGSFIKNHKGGSKRTTESDVPSLKLLPLSLLIELHFEVFTQLVVDHPMFGRLYRDYQDALVDICHSAMNETYLSKGEEPFHQRMPGTYMLFLVAGSVHYYPGHAQHLSRNHMIGSQDALRKQVDEGGHLCEGVLWMHWKHMGLLAAAGHSSVVKVIADLFRLNAQRSGLAFHFLHNYAQAFAKSAMEAIAQGEDFDDLFTMCRTPEELGKILGDDDLSSKGSQKSVRATSREANPRSVYWEDTPPSAVPQRVASPSVNNEDVATADNLRAI